MNKGMEKIIDDINDLNDSFSSDISKDVIKKVYLSTGSLERSEKILNMAVIYDFREYQIDAILDVINQFETNDYYNNGDKRELNDFTGEYESVYSVNIKRHGEVEVEVEVSIAEDSYCEVGRISYNNFITWYTDEIEFYYNTVEESDPVTNNKRVNKIMLWNKDNNVNYITYYENVYHTDIDYFEESFNIREKELLRYEKYFGYKVDRI